MRIVTDPVYGDHLRGIAHPESPDRVEMVASYLRDRGLLDDPIAARDATDEELLRVHGRQYLDLVQRETRGLRGPAYLSTGDVLVAPGSEAIARRAAGGAIVAMETAAATNAPVFALVRPPGHHAEPSRGMGFCVYNNAAIAARAFTAASGTPALVVDFDYHHGNGTEDAAGNGLSYVSTHASPAYPGTGYDTEPLGGRDVLVNVPLPVSGIATEAFVAIWDALVRDAARIVRPGAIVVSAGFDYVKGDPVGDLGVDVSAASALASAIAAIAAEYCDGRVAYVLEGGYDIAALRESIERVLLSAEKPNGTSDADPASVPRPQRMMLERLQSMEI